MDSQPSPGAVARSPWMTASRRLGEVLRRESMGGVLLLVATVVAVAWASSPASAGYFELRDAEFGPDSVGLRLSTGEWAADGLLAIFFFVVGLELKRELVAGALRDPRAAVLPVAGAVGGMAVPALLFVVINLGTGGDALRGWAIPTATDIAFALAVLAVVGRHLPLALRTFLLTLAVVDDLLAVTIIALFYSRDLDPLALLLAAVPLVAFGLIARRGIRWWWLLLPLAAATWGLVHASGVHATVAGVLLAFTVPITAPARAGAPATAARPAEHLEHALRPFSAAVAVPVFAFFAAGVAVGGADGLREAFRSPITVGIVIALVLGKTIGVFGAAWLLRRFTPARLDPAIRWPDLLGVSTLAGIGFTVSLLIGELAYDDAAARSEQVTIGVLAGSVISAIIASAILTARSRLHRRIRLAAAGGALSDPR